MQRHQRRIKETWLVNEWMSFHEAKRAINPSDKLHRSNVYSDEAEAEAEAAAASFRKGFDIRFSRSLELLWNMI